MTRRTSNTRCEEFTPTFKRHPGVTATDYDRSKFGDCLVQVCYTKNAIEYIAGTICWTVRSPDRVGTANDIIDELRQHSSVLRINVRGPKTLKINDVSCTAEYDKSDNVWIFGDMVEANPLPVLIDVTSENLLEMPRWQWPWRDELHDRPLSWALDDAFDPAGPLNGWFHFKVPEDCLISSDRVRATSITCGSPFTSTRSSRNDFLNAPPFTLIVLLHSGKYCMTQMTPLSNKKAVKEAACEFAARLAKGDVSFQTNDIHPLGTMMVGETVYDMNAIPWDADHFTKALNGERLNDGEVMSEDPPVPSRTPVPTPVQTSGQHHRALDAGDDCCNSLWNVEKTFEENKKNLLQNYVQRGKGGRFFHGFWNRHYVREVEAWLESGSNESWNALKEAARQTPDGSLSQRLKFIEERRAERDEAPTPRGLGS